MLHMQAPNACVSHSYFVTAIHSRHAQKPCIFDASVGLKAASVSSTIRMLLSKYRTVAKDEKARQTVVEQVVQALCATI